MQPRQIASRGGGGRAAVMGLGIGVAAILAGGRLEAQRVRDIARVDGVRPQHLTGIGLVVGLEGTGDSQQNSLMKKFYTQLITNMGDVVPFEEAEIKTRNTALVTVTASVASSLKVGSEFEVTVAAIGDAETIRNGYLLAVPLRGPSAVKRESGRAITRYFAVAQGPIFTERNEGKLRLGKARAVLEAPLDEETFRSNLEDITLVLNQPDYGMAARIAQKVNEHDLFRDPDSADNRSSMLARAVDETTVKVRIPTAYLKADRVIDFVSQVLEIEVPDLDQEALVAVHRQTGSVVINGNVRVAASAWVRYKGLMIRIPEAKKAEDAARSADLSAFERNPLLIDVVGVLEKSALELSGNDFVHILTQLHKAGAIIGKFVED